MKNRLPPIVKLLGESHEPESVQGIDQGHPHAPPIVASLLAQRFHLYMSWMNSVVGAARNTKNKSSPARKERQQL